MKRITLFAFNAFIVLLISYPSMVFAETYKVVVSVYLEPGNTLPLILEGTNRCLTKGLVTVHDNGIFVFTNATQCGLKKKDILYCQGNKIERSRSVTKIISRELSDLAKYLSAVAKTGHLKEKVELSRIAKLQESINNHENDTVWEIKADTICKKVLNKK